jgi:acyl-CoA reductase-like NAD-dependent aldehyde dehydrogenase
MAKTAISAKIKKELKPTNGKEVTKSRLDIRKTYKLFIDGKFPRTESGRFLPFKQGDTTVNICRASRKDIRDAVVSNRKAQESWSKRSAYNKGQILYRIAETLESRKAQFIDMLQQQGMNAKAAKAETEASIDLLVYYAGWTDKYIQIFSAVNPVESSHFNFSYPEPMGIMMVYPNEKSALISLVAAVAPVIAGGNTCTVVVSGDFPLTAIDFAEVLQASDVPGGVINILTGQRKELVSPAAMHMDINAMVFEDFNLEQLKSVQIQSAANLKRLINLNEEPKQSPYRILHCQEIKTTWHPVGA